MLTRCHAASEASCCVECLPVLVVDRKRIEHGAGSGLLRSRSYDWNGFVKFRLMRRSDVTNDQGPQYALQRTHKVRLRQSRRPIQRSLSIGLSGLQRRANRLSANDGYKFQPALPLAVRHWRAARMSVIPYAIGNEHIGELSQNLRRLSRLECKRFATQTATTTLTRTECIQAPGRSRRARGRAFFNPCRLAALSRISGGVCSSSVPSLLSSCCNSSFRLRSREHKEWKS